MTSTLAPTDSDSRGDEILEVKTGPLGLGKHLFVPLGMIHEVIEDSIFLAVGGYDDDIKQFKNKPDYLARLH